ncbi:FixH family protein [Mucilaginibacter paludis]|uniref:FixH family protein n=1 Tax=Mucilaginibacter paludis DSM 18603 TaxID=714943 RepID=H1YJ08_9SPHI|nr:FixH family protein [Mucilaginibacter paludis]EHQ27703.1 FixH family protein [Mucilaginibacter paludis DSM 18603]
MNWGKAIITGMITFMLFILAMSIYMFMAPTDDYDHQYYEKGLTFNHDYNREEQVTKDHAQPLVRLTDQNINFHFTAPAKGKVKFMRPANTALDATYQFNTDKGIDADLPRLEIPAGEWQLTVEWQSNQKSYLYHQELYIK